MNQEHERMIGNVACLAYELMPNLPYHNFLHAIDVYGTVCVLAYLSKTAPDDIFDLRTAALSHDLFVVPGADDNEERTAEFVRAALPDLGYSREQAVRAARLILPTKMPQSPKNLLEALLCDSDLGNLGRDDFFEKGEKIRIELEIPKGLEWYKQQLAFLKGHEYYTPVARKLGDKGKESNIWKLEKIIREGKC